MNTNDAEQRPNHKNTAMKKFISQQNKNEHVKCRELPTTDSLCILISLMQQRANEIQTGQQADN